jgi:hypothetical protein
MIIKSGGPGSESRRLAKESEAAFQRAGEATDPAVAALEFAEGVAQAGYAELAAAYTYLQRAVGVIAVLLPATLVFGHLALGGKGLRGSISAYYYTHMGNVFVGSLCALAVFFLSYNYRPIRSFEIDNLLSSCAFLAAVGVAVFPTAGNAVVADGGEKLVSTLHLCCAGVLFGLLGVFAHFRFTKTGKSGVMTPEKRRRNRLYRVCGKLIFVSMALVLVSNAIKPPSSWHALFWLETMCVEAFGVSWLVKGGFWGLLADKQAASGPR